MSRTCGCRASRFVGRGLRRVVWMLVPGVVLVVGCPEGAPIATTCARVGERCRMPDGPIGICGESLSACEEPPCLVCTSQH